MTQQLLWHQNQDLREQARSDGRAVGKLHRNSQAHRDRVNTQAVCRVESVSPWESPYMFCVCMCVCGKILVALMAMHFGDLPLFIPLDCVVLWFFPPHHHISLSFFYTRLSLFLHVAKGNRSKTQGDATHADVQVLGKVCVFVGACHLLS